MYQHLGSLGLKVKGGWKFVQDSAGFEMAGVCAFSNSAVVNPENETDLEGQRK